MQNLRKSHKKKMYTINIALAISLIIGTLLQVSMFVATIILRRHANKTLESAKNLSEETDEVAAEAERIHKGAMICMKMANEMFFCRTPDERANLIIQWMPRLQEVGVNINDINEIINNQRFD